MTRWLFVILLLAGCSSANLDDVKTHADATWAQAGYTIIGYEGYQWGFWGLNGYGGAYVWHTLRRPASPHVIYSGYIQRWGTEYHIYGPRAVDAVMPH